MGYHEFLTRLRETHPQLADALATVTSLEKILAWLPTVGVALDQLDLLTQDEYSHDLLVPLKVEGQWLVFGMT